MLYYNHYTKENRNFMKILIVVDMQKDFISGPLGTLKRALSCPMWQRRQKIHA